MYKKILFVLFTSLFIIGCNKSKKTVNYTDKLELASVSVNRTFVMNDKKGKFLGLIPYEKAGDRVAIFRMGASVFTAYINLQKIKVDSDKDGNYTIKCPKIEIEGPDYIEYDKLTCKYKKIDYEEDRKDFEPEEVNEEEKKAFEEIKKLRDDETFIEELKEKARESANIKLKKFIAMSEGINVDNIKIDYSSW